MIAGKDFPSPFEKDLFTERRSGTCYTSGNPFDPESLLTGAEMAAGLDYGDKRSWPNEALYRAAIGGQLTTDEIARIAPRQRSVRCPSLDPRNTGIVGCGSSNLDRFKGGYECRDCGITFTDESIRLDQSCEVTREEFDRWLRL